MRRFSITFMAVFILMCVAPLAGAQGDEVPDRVAEDGVVSAAARPNGLFYAWNVANRGPGRVCTWSGNDSDWGNTSPATGTGCNNETSAVWNNGVPHTYDDVWMFKDIGYGSPWMCLGRGDRWDNLGLGIERWSDGSWANDDISSHYWGTNCP